MHTAIFFAIIPEKALRGEWKDEFAAAAQKISTTQLGKYVWQVNFQSAPGEPAQLINYPM
jgi:hypothetical protein